MIFLLRPLLLAFKKNRNSCKKFIKEEIGFFMDLVSWLIKRFIKCFIFDPVCYLIFLFLRLIEGFLNAFIYARRDLQKLEYLAMLEIEKREQLKKGDNNNSK